jgi:hypothetical protein
MALPYNPRSLQTPPMRHIALRQPVLTVRQPTVTERLQVATCQRSYGHASSEFYQRIADVMASLGLAWFLIVSPVDLEAAIPWNE